MDFVVETFLVKVERNVLLILLKQQGLKFDMLVNFHETDVGIYKAYI